MVGAYAAGRAFAREDANRLVVGHTGDWAPLVDTVVRLQAERPGVHVSLRARSTSRLVAGLAVETVIERTSVHKVLERIRDVLPGGEDTWDQEAGINDPAYQLAMLRWREEHMLAGVARRLKRGMDSGMEPADVFSRCQGHVIGAARAHVERLVLEAFVDRTAAMPDSDNKVALNLLCDLFALSTIEADRAWWMEHGRLSSARAKAITREVDELCRRIRPLAQDVVDAFGVPAEMQAVEMIDDSVIDG